MRPFKKWTVLSHDKPVTFDGKLLTVVGNLPMPLGGFPRRMTAVRLRDGRLVIFSAIALHEPEMHALEAFGDPAFLIVPSSIHRMDAKIWKDRYPALQVVAPEGAREKVEEVVPVDATHVDFDDPTVRLLTVPGTDNGELALLVESPGGTTLVISDVIWNVHDRPGFRGWLFHKLGLTADKPQIARVVRLRTVKDESALRAGLEAWAQLPDLKRIIVSHGEIIERDSAAVLRDLAGSLAA